MFQIIVTTSENLATMKMTELMTRVFLMLILPSYLAGSPVMHKQSMAEEDITGEDAMQLVTAVTSRKGKAETDEDVLLNTENDDYIFETSLQGEAETDEDLSLNIEDDDSMFEVIVITNKSPVYKVAMGAWYTAKTVREGVTKLMIRSTVVSEEALCQEMCM